MESGHHHGPSVYPKALRCPRPRAYGVPFTLSNSDSSNPQTAAAPESPSCRTDWKVCASNEEMVNNWSGRIGVQVDCKMAANDFAKYGTPEWPWLALGNFRIGSDYISKGIAIAIEDNARFSNGFGAMAKVKVTCTYDLKNSKVIDIDVSMK